MFGRIKFPKKGMLDTRRMTRCQALIRCHLLFADLSHSLFLTLAKPFEDISFD
jgi:hypothetical protein